MNWIYEVKGKNKWRGLVNTLTKFRVPYSEGNFFISLLAIKFGVKRRMKYEDYIFLKIRIR